MNILVVEDHGGILKFLKQGLEEEGFTVDIAEDGLAGFSKVQSHFNTFNDSQGNFGTYAPNHCTFNPLDKLIEAYEENRKLYERLLEAERRR